jgi:RimJ/RimL family protein N-acetyltransferase
MISGDRLPTLEGARLRLRWLVQEDAVALYQVFSNVEAMRYWSHPPFTRPEQATELVAEIHRCFAARSLFQWGIARRHDDRVVGTCTLSSLDRNNGRAELGYALGWAHWGQGWMAEALTTLIDFACGELGLRRLEADVDPRNERSIRSLERLGFHREGYLRERWVVGGEVQDSALYALLKREWDTLRAAQRTSPHPPF